MLKTLKQFIGRQFLYPNVAIPSSRELSDMTVVVTGAGRGIGKAIAEMIYAEGGRVVGMSLQRDSLKKAFPRVDARRFIFVEGDVSREKDVRILVDGARRNFGKVDVLVNNAGINSAEKPLEEISIEDFDRMISTNVRGAFLLSREIIPLMKEAGSGYILNIGSKISHNTNVSPNKTVYAMTKYALEGFSFALNRELKSSGIRVSCLLPGTVNTFASFGAKRFLSPYQVAEVACMMIRYTDIDFENVIFKSRKQNL